MIPATVWLFRDLVDPRIYRIAITPGFNATMDKGAEIMPWNEARESLPPETFYAQCRMAFSDWCARNPELADGR